MTDDAEKRFERAMDKLFHPKLPSSATSSPGTPQPKELANSVYKALPGRMSKGPSSSRISPQPRRLSGSNLKSTSTSMSSPAPMCRPWDRRDLMRRLATFKSMTWFGKPKVVGPVNCARRGWINVDVDLIACEACGTRLSFSTPPTLTKQQVENAATLFSSKLDDGHKSLCPWKGNDCEEALAHFPPTPAPALVESYRDRCDALLQLPALPAISSSAIEQMKISRGLQIDCILAQPPPLPTSLLSRHSGNRSDIEIDGTESSLTAAHLYYQAQRIISLCGWEPRLLPYIVDCEDFLSEIVKDANPGEASSPLCHAHSPSVLLRSRSQANEVGELPTNKSASLKEMPDPASVVLDCTLCGASVGMWAFMTIYRPSQLMYDAVETHNICRKQNESGICNLSVASCIGGISTSEGKGKEHQDDIGEGMASSYQKNASDERVLDLSLTIAGGLPPTKQNSSSLLPLPSIRQFKASGFPCGNEVGERVTSTKSPKAQGKMQIIRQHGSSVNSIKDIRESVSIDREGIDTAGSSERKRIEGKASERVNDTDGNSRNKRKRDGAIIGERCIQEIGSSEYRGLSSVNAVDTCYHDRKENSTDSVDNITHFSCKSDKGVEEGTGTNIATVSTGRIGNSASVGMSFNATQIEAHGEVCGNDISVNRDESRVAESVVLVETARSVQQSEIVSRGDKQHSVSICEDGQHALLVVQALADNNSSKDSLANEVGMDSQAGGERSEVYEPPEGNEKMEKSNSVMAGPHDSAKIDSVAISSSGIGSEESPRKRMEFDSIRQHRHFCPWVHVIGGILGSGQNTGLCGWQLTIDALDQCNAQELASACLKESESTSSRYKANPVASVRHLFETPSKKTKHSHVRSTNDS